MTKKYTFFVLIVLLIGMSACSTSPDGMSTQAGNPVQLEIEHRTDLQPKQNEVMIAQADAIFLGRVDWISETMPTNGSTHHQVAVTVLQSMVDEVNLGSGGILTVAGPSPVDNDAPSTGAMQIANLARHNLKVGDEAVFFVHEAQVMHSGEIQLVLTPFSDMSQSIVSADQFDALIVQVQQQRPYQAQPTHMEALGTY